MELETPGLPCRTALDEVARLDQAVRLRSRWYGTFLLTLAGGTVAYYTAVNLATGSSVATVLVLAAGWTGFAVALAGWARRQPVTWLGIRRLRMIVIPAYFALCAVTVLLNVTVLRDSPARWGLGLVAALPCLGGAWAVLRR